LKQSNQQQLLQLQQELERAAKCTVRATVVSLVVTFSN